MTAQSSRSNFQTSRGDSLDGVLSSFRSPNTLDRTFIVSTRASHLTTPSASLQSAHTVRIADTGFLGAPEIQSSRSGSRSRFPTELSLHTIQPTLSYETAPTDATADRTFVQPNATELSGNRSRNQAAPTGSRSGSRSRTSAASNVGAGRSRDDSSVRTNELPPPQSAASNHSPGILDRTFTVSPSRSIFSRLPTDSLTLHTIPARISNFP